MLLGLLLAVATSQVPARSAPSDFRLAAVPAVTYGSDVGLSLGSAAFLYRPADVAGRWERISIGAAWASRGPRFLQLKWEKPELGALGWGFLADLRLADDNREPYWGEGAALGGSTVSPGSGSPPDPYRYHDRRAQFSLTVRRTTARSPSPFFRARWLGLDVLDAGPLLGAARPPGHAGGGDLLAEAGLFVDTRDRDVGTRKGFLASASAFGAPRMGKASDGSFAGVNLYAAAFLPVSKRMTLAARVLYDAKLGEVPFYERQQYEGIAYGTGLGGADTLRGVARSRLSGDEKGLASAELRTAIAEVHPFGTSPLQLGLATGIDLGYARQRGHAPLAALSGFVGLRALWDRAVLLRFEVGYSGQGSPAVYVVTGEQF